MTDLLKVAVAGVGRMGQIHALHVQELASEGACQLVAIAESEPTRAQAFLERTGIDIPVYDSVQSLAEANVADATVIVTPTHAHHEHASTLIRAGQRVLLEKPLTGTLEGDTEFCATLDRDYPNALMLAFQRRFDPALHYAKELMQSGLIGRVFKVYSALEDSNPAPDGYVSGGILPDMSVHNVDEILWFVEQLPERALCIGSRIYSHKHTTSDEDFDDALLYMWFPGELVAQVQVSRNHVSGYRVETILFGEKGQIQIGHFDQKPFDISVQAFGKRGSAEPLASKTFSMRDYGRPLPEFIDRFGPAYKKEVAVFIECCRTGEPFPSTHNDGLRAQRVISAAMAAVIGPDHAKTL
jgi:myo-inositol 2-dehydrogenase/D-chiro-inositol 1-dehydrogenase